MTFIWDSNKNDINFKIHKIRFETAVVFFMSDDNPDVEYDTEHSDDEERFRGTFRRNDSYLFISYTVSDDTVRIISVRLATRGEVDNYYKRN